MKHKLYPCIWSTYHNAKAMANFYIDAFPDAKITEENALVVMLELSGQQMMLLNGGEMFSPNPSVSFMGVFKDGAEIDPIWNKLLEGATILMDLGEYPFSKRYGWLSDKYGVSWQFYTGEDGGASEKYVPTLMFTGANAGKAKDAIASYTSIFPQSEVQGILEYPEGSGDVPGYVQHAQFNIAGYTLMCMDSSLDHKFGFSEGISLVVNCKDQSEIDYYWNNLIDNGGKESQCGWLTDKYGLSWQIIPENIYDLLKKSPKVMEAVLKMKKLDLSVLENASIS